MAREKGWRVEEMWRKTSEELTPVAPCLKSLCLDLIEAVCVCQPGSASLCNVKGPVGRPAGGDDRSWGLINVWQPTWTKNSVNTLWTLSHCSASLCALRNTNAVLSHKFFACQHCKKAPHDAILICKWVLTVFFSSDKCRKNKFNLFPILVNSCQVFKSGFIVLHCGAAQCLILFSRCREVFLK